LIVISPYSRPLSNGKNNPKNYPFWEELISMIKEPIVQIGVEGEVQLVEDFRKGLPISQLKELLRECRTWISCDSFFQHLGWIEGKKGIVLWSVSDPLIYGHPENTNLLKDRKYLAGNQFLWWEAYDHNAETFVSAREVFKCL
jgi:ADP-heptose:LPS heptosyltransferase